MTVAKTVEDSSEAWPALPLSAWADTYATLHMWTQIVGKVRLALSPRVNHWWEVPLYVSARGLTTSPIPYRQGVFEVQFDFIDHRLEIVTSSGETKTIRLEPRTVADFHAEFFSLLRSLGIEVKIWNMPVEIPNPIRFDQDRDSLACTIRNMPKHSGEFSSRQTPSLRNFVAAFLAKSAQSISFGGVLISNT